MSCLKCPVSGAPLEVLWKPLEYREMFLKLQPGKHYQHDERRRGVLGVRAFFFFCETLWYSSNMQTLSFCPRPCKRSSVVPQKCGYCAIFGKRPKLNVVHQQLDLLCLWVTWVDMHYILHSLIMLILSQTEHASDDWWFGEAWRD